MYNDNHDDDEEEEEGEEKKEFQFDQLENRMKKIIRFPP